MMLRPRLIALTDTLRCPAPVLLERLERLSAAAKPGSVMLQLRDRQLSDRERVTLGRKLCEIARRHGQLFAVNDRADLAVLLGADALHLGEASLPASEARKIAGNLWLSRACHDPLDAGAQGADAVVLSPILGERKGRPALGVAALHVARGVAGNAVRLYALGGIDAAGARRCLLAQADGIAAIGAALDSDDPIPLLAAIDALR